MSKKRKPKQEAPDGKQDAPPEGAAAEETAQQEEREKLEERLLRLRADFENFRKRTIREKAEIHRQANEQLIEELLPVLDHLDIALSAAEEHGADSAFVEGFRLVAEQLLSVLSKFGLVPIDAKGEDFDHNRHEAVSHLPSADVTENGIITQVRRGYALGGKLLRPAQVVVSSGPPATERETDTDTTPHEQ